MRHRLLFIILGLIVIWSVAWADSGNLVPSSPSPDHRPIVMIIADKMDSMEFYQSRLPGIHQLINESACGLMTIRSGSGYTNTNSAYLTLGSGNRSVAPGVLNGAYALNHLLGATTAGRFWSWSAKVPDSVVEPNLVIPEVGWIYNQAEVSARIAAPGLLGNLFRKNGWKTVLIGNIDNADVKNRPAGLLLMDEDGIIDEGAIEENINEYDPGFPYGFRFSSRKVKGELKKYLQNDTLIVVEFGDFARLDMYQPEMNTVQFRRLKSSVWRRFDRFITSFSKDYPVSKVNLIVLSPSISRENWLNKKWFAPVVIRSQSCPAGILTSGTTNWPGVVSNLDVLPTLSVIGGLPLTNRVSGRPVSVDPVPDHLKRLRQLHARINSILTQQRSMIDWYLGIISVGWGAGIIAWFWRKRQVARWLWYTVAGAPLALMLLPLLPPLSWNVTGFLLTAIILGTLCSLIDSGQNNAFFWMTFIFWGILTVDQVTGWNLVRFSALGYSAAAGSRYYGMGNELGGIYLPVALVAAHFLGKRCGKKWPVFIILGITMIILGWPKFGVDFGGTLAGGLGFLYYGLNLFGIRLNNKKLWLVTGAGLLIVLAIGFWDAMRPPQVQTHVGLFFGLILDGNLTEIGSVFLRKLSMNLRLVVYSPWMRIVLMAALIGMGIRFYLKTANLKYDRLIWTSIIITGLVALIVNDSGVVALGTCLAYGFTYRLLDVERLSFSQAINASVSGRPMQ